MVADALIQQFEDTLFELVNTDDDTKKLGFDLADATASTKTTIKAAQSVNRTITLPDKDGVLDTVEQTRQECGCTTIDYEIAEILYKTLPANTTLTIDNPVQGKMVLLEANGNNFDLILPPTCITLSGRFKKEQVNYIYFHCIKGGLDPVYVVTIGQQIS